MKRGEFTFPLSLKDSDLLPRYEFHPVDLPSICHSRSYCRDDSDEERGASESSSYGGAGASSSAFASIGGAGGIARTQAKRDLAKGLMRRAATAAALVASAEGTLPVPDTALGLFQPPYDKFIRPVVIAAALQEGVYHINKTTPVLGKVVRNILAALWGDAAVAVGGKLNHLVALWSDPPEDSEYVADHKTFIHELSE